MTEQTNHSADLSTENPAATTRPRPSMKYGWVVMGLAVTAALIAQLFAPQFDYQNANLIGLLCVVFASVFFLFCLHRRAVWAGHRWRIPALVLAAVAALLVCFRIDGFSGEMVPQLKWRFAAEESHELKVVAEAADPTDAAASDSSNESPSSSQFLGGNRNGVYDLRAFEIPERIEDVEVLWDQGVGSGWSSFVVADGRAITLEQRDGEECLTCYRLGDGALLWIVKNEGVHQHALGGVGPRSTPTIEGNFVYATTATGLLWCVDRRSGDVIWKRDLLEIAGWNQQEFETAAPWGYSVSPLLIDGRCIVALGGPASKAKRSSLIAFSAESGDDVWRGGDDQLSYASPMSMTFGDSTQIVSVNEASVTGHDIENGKRLWVFDWPGSTNTGANCASAVQVGPNRVLVGKGYGGGSALVQISRGENGWRADDVWRSRRILKTKFNHTCVMGDVGFGINNGQLQAVDLNEATAYWTQPRRNRAAEGHCVLVQDTLVVQDEAGDIVFVDAATGGYFERFRMEALSSKTWNIPTVAGRYLLVRNDRQAICFKLPARDPGNDLD